MTFRVDSLENLGSSASQSGDLARPVIVASLLNGENGNRILSRPQRQLLQSPQTDFGLP